MVVNSFFKKKNFLIAEAGINHNGMIKTALKLVDTAKKSGADAIKFQTYITEKRIPKKYLKIFNILKKCQLPFKSFKIIKDYCKEKKIIFFSTPFDTESVDYLDSIQVKLFKVASFDIGNKELVKKILEKSKPTIFSTGMASLKEIDNVYRSFNKNKVELAFLHCVSSYPNTDTNSYLSNIKYLQRKYNCQIGISDHTNDIKIPLYGNILGANIIEKHLKIDHNHICVDAPVSITGKQFRELKNETDKIHTIINKPIFGIRKAEKSSIIFKRKKIYR
jgi:N,N'-diacetyllegionaminate synthase